MTTTNNTIRTLAELVNDRLTSLREMDLAAYAERTDEDVKRELLGSLVPTNNLAMHMFIGLQNPDDLFALPLSPTEFDAIPHGDLFHIIRAAIINAVADELEL